VRLEVVAGVLEHGQSAEAGAKVLGHFLRALVAANVDYLRRHPSTPHPYRAGIRYQREPRGQEAWKGIGQVLADRHGDCEDLASYLAAWYVAHGQRAQIHLVWRRRRNGGRLFHVQVRGPSGQVEDPSAVLGM